MIAVFCFNWRVRIHWFRHGTDGKREGSFLEWAYHASTHHPAKITLEKKIKYVYSRHTLNWECLGHTVSFWAIRDLNSLMGLFTLGASKRGKRQWTNGTGLEYEAQGPLGDNGKIFRGSNETRTLDPKTACPTALPVYCLLPCLVTSHVNRL